MYHYKILTKILANRVKHILPEVMSEKQRCSIPNRTVWDLTKCTKEKIDITFLLKTMKKLGISQIFVNFIRIPY